MNTSNINPNIDLKTAPAEQPPTVPLHGFFPNAPDEWLARHEKYSAIAKQGMAQIVFLGDSITEDWGGKGKIEWESRFAPLGAVNFGIGGDRTQQILWRIANGTLENLSPALVVLKIGVNNLWWDAAKYGTTAVVDGIKAVVDTIHTHLPQTKILVLGILPTQQDPAHPLREALRTINAQVASVDNGTTIRFRDIGAVFLEADGRINPAIMYDYVHLTEQGYTLFANELEPLIREMLKG